MELQQFSQNITDQLLLEPDFKKTSVKETTVKSKPKLTKEVHEKVKARKNMAKPEIVRVKSKFAIMGQAMEPSSSTHITVPSIRVDEATETGDFSKLRQQEVT